VGVGIVAFVLLHSVAMKSEMSLVKKQKTAHNSLNNSISIFSAELTAIKIALEIVIKTLSTENEYQFVRRTWWPNVTQLSNTYI
jgi:hypothetical protein